MRRKVEEFSLQSIEFGHLIGVCTKLGRLATMFRFAPLVGDPLPRYARLKKSPLPAGKS